MATSSSEGGASESSGRRSGAVPSRQRFARFVPWIIGAVTFLTLVALLRPLVGQREMLLAENSIAPIDVFAPVAFTVEEPEATAQMRARAAESVPPVLLKLASPPLIADTSIERMFQVAAEVRSGSATPQERFELLDTRLRDELGVRLTAPALRALDFNADFVTYREDLRNVVAAVFNEGIVEPGSTIEVVNARRQAGLGGSVSLLGADGMLRQWFATEHMRSLADATDFVRRRLQQPGAYPRVEDVPRLDLAEEMARAVLAPNLIYLSEETQKRRDEAAAETPPVLQQVRKGERICSEGDRITPLQAAKLKRLAELRGPQRPARLIGYSALALLPLVLIAAFLRRYDRDALRSSATLLTVALSVLMVLGLAKVVVILRFAHPNLQELPYAIPVASCGILLTVLRSGRLAVFVVNLAAILCCIVLGAEWNLRYVIVLAWSSMLGIFMLGSVRKRTDPYLAGLVVSLTAVLLILCLAVYDYPTMAEFSRNFRPHVLVALLSGAGNGLLSVGLAVVLLPLFEWLLGVTTDIRLLELATGSKLLKTLAEKAPGTYHHSLMVATLAEAAADAIGANGLLCRVGAYYHDIGKMNNPQYFAENQPGGSMERSPHDRITPNMSVRIIRNHVKDGIEMARENGLPPAIQAFIPEHHGTTISSYFYAKALENNPRGDVREEDFRYLGPKPQSVETAIVMIADTIEAASRTLDPRISEGQIVQFVRKAINDKFIDDQFDECDLTMRELHLLAQSFARTLGTIMHRRIVYPESPPAGGEGKRSLAKEKAAAKPEGAPKPDGPAKLEGAAKSDSAAKTEGPTDGDESETALPSKEVR